MICSNCGQPLDEGKLFCGNCGHLNSQNSQEQKSIKALELAKANKYDLFTLGWAVLITFTLGRHFAWLPEISAQVGSIAMPSGIAIPAIGNNWGSNLAFVILIIFNTLSVWLVLNNNNKLNKNVSGVAGTVLLLMSPVSLIFANLIGLDNNNTIVFFVVISISEFIFYLGINVFAISKINYKEPQFISSLIVGMVIGIVASLAVPIIAFRFTYLSGLTQLVINNVATIGLVIFTFTKQVHNYEENTESNILQAKIKPIAIGLFFAPLLANILVGYIFYLRQWL
jgi:hypothetical protein